MRASKVRNGGLAGAVVLSIISLGGVSSAGVVVPASVPAGFYLSSGPMFFRVGGHTWSVALSAEGRSAFVNISTGHEADAWTVKDLPASDLRVNTETGHVTFDSRNSMAPVAHVNLKFTKMFELEASCPIGGELVFDEKVTGSFSITTARGGPKFASRHPVFKSASLVMDQGCSFNNGSRPACSGGSWDAGARTGTVTGNTPPLVGQRKYTVEIDMTRRLASPKHSFVRAEISGTGTKPKLKGETLFINEKGVVSGTGTIKDTAKPAKTTRKCLIGSKQATETTLRFVGRYRSPKRNELRARSLVFGELKVPATGSSRGSFSIVTVQSDLGRLVGWLEAADGDGHFLAAGGH